MLFTRWIRSLRQITETVSRRQRSGQLPRRIRFDLECLEGRVVPSTAPITLSDLPADTVGVYYDQTITASGGSGTISFTVANLSAVESQMSAMGLTMTGGDGSSTPIAISGTPTVAGSVPFSVTATDSAGDTTTNTDSTVTTINFNSGSATHLADGDLDAYTSYTQGGFVVAPDVAIDGWGAHEHINSMGLYTHIHDDEPGGAGVIIVQQADGGAFVLDSLNVPELYTGTSESGSLTFTASNGDTFTASTMGTYTPNWGPITSFTITPNNIDDSQGGMGYVNDIVLNSLSNYTLTVNPVATLSPSPLPSSAVGVAYNPNGLPSIITSGGTGLSNLAVTNVNGPNLGLTIQTLTPDTDADLVTFPLDSATNLSSAGPGLIITGTPTAAGTDTFTVTATDALGVTTTTNYSITINPKNKLTIETASLPAATVSDSYDVQLKAKGGGTGTDYTYTAEAPLPVGLALSPSGLLSGTPTTTPGLPVSLTISVLVNDSRGDSGLRNYTLTIDPALSLSPSTLGIATVGDAFSTLLDVTGGSGKGYKFKATDLPGWLKLSSTGLLHGTPPATADSTVSFSITATDSKKGTVTNSYTLTVDPALTVLPATLNAVAAGGTFSTQLTAAGGSGAGYSFASVYMPAWMTISSTGLLSGTVPTKVDSPVIFIVKVTDSDGGTAEHSFSLAINPGITLSPGTIPVATVGDEYDAQLAAKGGSGQGYTFSAENLPLGLTISSTGLLSGMPTDAFPVSITETITVTVTDSNGASASRNYSLTIDPALTLSPGTLNIATVGDLFQTPLTASGGSGAGYTFKASGLPSWLSLSSGTGLLSGTPPAAAAFTTTSFSITVTDSEHATVTTGYSLYVDPALTLQATLPAATAGVNYDQQLEASGGSGTYTFTSTDLPSWLKLSSTGVLTGMPPAIAHDVTYSFQVTVTDSTGATVTQEYTLTEDTAITS